MGCSSLEHGHHAGRKLSLVPCGETIRRAQCGKDLLPGSSQPESSVRTWTFPGRLAVRWRRVQIPDLKSSWAELCLFYSADPGSDLACRYCHWYKSSSMVLAKMSQKLKLYFVSHLDLVLPLWNKEMYWNSLVDLGEIEVNKWKCVSMLLCCIGLLWCLNLGQVEEVISVIHRKGFWIYS